jgi:tetratricopeptide (TPR) repeat protein
LLNPDIGQLAMGKAMRLSNTSPDRGAHSCQRGWLLKTSLFISSAAILFLTVSHGVQAESSAWRAAYTQGVDALNEQDLTEAEEHFRKALSLVQSQSRQTEDTEKCMLKLADTLALSYKTEEARTLYEKLLGDLTGRYGSNSSHLARVLIPLGSIEESEGNHQAAMQYYSRALRVNDKNFGPYSPAYTSMLHRLAITTYKSGHKLEAERRYKQAKSILVERPGLEASKKLEALTNEYGDLLKGNDHSNRDLIRDFQLEVLGAGDQSQVNQSNRYADRPKPKQDTQTGEEQNKLKLRGALEQPPPALPGASSSWQQQSESLMQASGQGQTDENSQIAARSITRPDSDAALAPAFKIVNDTIFNQGHYEKSESYNERMIAADIDALGPNHPSVANDLAGLAQIYLAQRRYSDAEPLLKRALSIYRQVYGSNNLLTVNTMASLASAQFQLGYYEQSAQLYKEALNAAQQVTGPNSLETARILNGLANLYFHQGKLSESCTLYQWAVASTQSALGDNSPLLAASLKDYAQVLRSLGRETDALAVEARATKILAESK